MREGLFLTRQAQSPLTLEILRRPPGSRGQFGDETTRVISLEVALGVQFRFVHLYKILSSPCNVV